MSSRKRRKEIKELRKGGISGSELVRLGILPKNYHLDDGNDGDVGDYINGRKGKSTVKRIGGLSVPSEPTNWWKKMSETT